MGWTVDALWAAPRVSLGSPISGPTGAGAVSGGVHSTGAVSPPTRCGSSTSAGMPSAASRMGVEALPGAFPWKGTGIAENPVKSPI